MDERHVRSDGDFSTLLPELEAALGELESAALHSFRTSLDERLKPVSERISSLESQRATGGRSAKRIEADSTSPTYEEIELPARLSLSSLVRYLEERQFVVENNRGSSGGSLWVVWDRRFAPIAEALVERGVSVREKSDRRRRTGRFYLLDEDGALK